jgi:hypothetical protein
MDTTISQESYEFILEQLESDDRDCAWQIARFNPKDPAYVYWKQKQTAIKKALKELRA